MDIVTYALCKKYIEQSLAGAGALKGDTGATGKSAYELAVKNGYSGTETDWLASLQGAAGKSAYELAVDNGYTGTVIEWIASLQGLQGKSAFDLAVESGFSGTETDWLASLKGTDGKTPYLGDNGNWFIGDTDTGILGKVITNYLDLTNRPNILTIQDIKDAGYITSTDIEDLAQKSEIPKNLSDLTNDLSFKTINNESILGSGNIEIDTCKVNDVKINGESVVTDKIANINLDLNATIGKTFVTNNTVGFLASGTSISATDTLADILYKILYKSEAVSSTVTLIFGGADNIPNSEDDLTWLDWREEVTGLDPNSLLQSSYTHLITTGNLTTEDGQYPVMACSKSVKLIKLSKWVARGAETIALNYNSVETDNYNIYYIPTQTYDENKADHGTYYVFTFVEEEK